MRVTHVITRLIIGGAQENTITSVLGLAARPDLQVDLVSGPTTGPEGSLEATLRQSPGLLTISPHLVRPIHPWKDALAYRDLTRLFRETKPDLVHTHSGKAGLLGRMAAANARTPIIVHSIHGPSFGSFQAWLPNLLFRAAERYAGSLTDHFVVVADAMKEQYLAAGIGRPDQYTRISSGFNLQPFLEARNDAAVRARFGFKPDDFVVGKIARLFKLKGHNDLLASLPDLVRSFPRTRVLLVGDGPWRQRFEQQVHDLGLQKHVAFAGLVRPNQVAELVGIMDVLVHLSTREGLPRALPQAMAAAKPVVAYDADGAREVCINGKTGFLLPVGDRTGLSRALTRLAQEAQLREQFGSAGRELVRREFEAETMVGRIYQLYQKLARDAKTGRMKAP